VEHIHGNWPGAIPEVHRWSYDYSKPGYEEDFVPQTTPMYEGEEELILSKPGKKITFPAIVQAKVDGIRALPQLKDGEVMLESRNGNSFVYLNHLRDEIKKFLESNNCPDLILDGEVYVHTLYRDTEGNPTENESDNLMKGVERYQYISKVCKVSRSNPHEYEQFAQYWIFDIWDLEITNAERYDKLKDMFSNYDGDMLKLVPTRIVDNHDEIEEFMKELVGENNGREGYEFEGLMVRQHDSKYMSSKTHQSCLLKYKRFEDEEWEVYDADRCNGGTQDGAIKWMCRKEINGKEKMVTAKQMGDSEDSKKIYLDYIKNKSKYIGKMINIRFNDRSKDNVPRFPRATAFVEDK
jgi:ATP-dependent DNA ligase